MKSRIALIIAVAAASVLPAVADSLYSTGFESPTFATVTIAGQDGWGVFGASAAAQVENTFAESGSQALEVVPELASSQTGPFYALSTAATQVELSAYIYIASTSAAGQSAWQFAATGPAFAGFIGGVNIQSDGAIDLITAAGTDVGTFTYNSWQLLDFVFNFATQTYDFSLNGTLISSNDPFCGSNSVCNGANVASFGDAIFDTFPATSAGDIGYMDNIAISSIASTPEPGSVILLGTAIAALFTWSMRRYRVLR